MTVPRAWHRMSHVAHRTHSLVPLALLLRDDPRGLLVVLALAFGKASGAQTIDPFLALSPRVRCHFLVA